MNYISSQTHLLANIKLSGTNQMFYSMYLLKNRLIQWYSGTYKTMEIEDNYQTKFINLNTALNMKHGNSAL